MSEEELQDEGLEDSEGEEEEQEQQQEPSSAGKSRGKGSKRKAVQQFFDEDAEADEDENEEEEERGGGRKVCVCVSSVLCNAYVHYMRSSAHSTQHPRVHEQPSLHAVSSCPLLVKCLLCAKSAVQALELCAGYKTMCFHLFAGSSIFYALSRCFMA